MDAKTWEEGGEGRLDPALRVFLDAAAHLRADPRWIEESGDVIGGFALENETPVAVAADAFDQVMARIDALSAAPEQSREAARRAGKGLQEILDLPPSVRDKALDALSRKGWAFAGPGIRQLSLPTEGEAKLDLFRIEPGAKTPVHDHGGRELTLVLTGAYRDKTGRYAAGDIAVGQPGLVHQPIAEPGEVCYALAVTVAPLQLQGVMGVLQRALKLN